jgi:hypothetical protein
MRFKDIFCSFANVKCVHVFVNVIVIMLVGVLTACEAAYPPSSGYVEECLGGDLQHKLNGAAPQFQMRVAATEQQWPDLLTKLEVFGSIHKLSVFNTSKSPEGLRMFEVSLCTSKGLWLYAEKQNWAQGPDRDPNHVLILLFIHNPAYDWQRIAADLERSFHDWPGAVQSKYLTPQIGM